MPSHQQQSDELVQIVHDLKSPLAAIALEMCLLADTLAPASPTIERAMLRVTHNVMFIDRLVEDLLDSCVIDDDHLVLQRGPTKLRTLLAAVIDRTVSARDRPRVSLDATLELTLEIDALRIERVVANLLLNALKYSPAAGAVVVRLEITTELARVWVIDAGSGVTTEDSYRIFDKYHRAPSAHDQHGHGLGLYVSKRIVEAHGGRIGVEHGHAAGSRFFFELPLA